MRCRMPLDTHSPLRRLKCTRSCAYVRLRTAAALRRCGSVVCGVLRLPEGRFADLHSGVAKPPHDAETDLASPSASVRPEIVSAPAESGTTGGYNGAPE